MVMIDVDTKFAQLLTALFSPLPPSDRTPMHDDFFDLNFKLNGFPPELAHPLSTFPFLKVKPKFYFPEGVSLAFTPYAIASLYSSVFYRSPTPIESDCNCFLFLEPHFTNAEIPLVFGVFHSFECHLIEDSAPRLLW